MRTGRAAPADVLGAGQVSTASVCRRCARRRSHSGYYNQNGKSDQDAPVAPVLLMRSEPARSHSVSLPTERTPEEMLVPTTPTMSRQWEREECALMSWQPTARCSKPAAMMSKIWSGDVTSAARVHGFVTPGGHEGEWQAEGVTVHGEAASIWATQAVSTTWHGRNRACAEVCRADMS